MELTFTCSKCNHPIDWITNHRALQYYINGQNSPLIFICLHYICSKCGDSWLWTYEWLQRRQILLNHKNKK